MVQSYRALCSDFYVNQKLSVKMDLPAGRETVLDLVNRIRREIPAMDRFRRFEEEVSLESGETDGRYQWLALTGAAIRTGAVNPDSLEDAHRLHRLLLEVSPFYLAISPIDVEFIELVYGFDVTARTNRNEVVYEALLGDSALAGLIRSDQESVLDAQPFFGLCLSPACDVQAFVEVKTRTRAAEIAAGCFDDLPISIYLTVRRYGPLREVEEFTACSERLSETIEEFAAERVVPHVLMPIREAVIARPG